MRASGSVIIPSFSLYIATVACGGNSNFFSLGLVMFDKSLLRWIGSIVLLSLGPPGKKTVLPLPAVNCDKVSSSVSSARAKMMRGSRFALPFPLFSVEELAEPTGLTISRPKSPTVWYIAAVCLGSNEGI